MELSERRSWPRTLVVLVGVGLAVAAAALSQAATAQDQQDEPVVEAARQVTDSPNPLRLFNSPTIAVHPEEPRTAVVAVGDTRNGGCGLHVTRDAGLSWSTTAADVMPEDLPYCVHRNYGPYNASAFNSEGTLFMAMGGSSDETEPAHPNGPITALIARTDDLGATHDTFTVAEPGSYTYEPEDGPAEEGFEQHRYASLATDPTDPDKLYRGWRVSIGGTDAPWGAIPVRSMMAVSDDGGETWTEPIDLLDAAGMDDVYGSDVPMPVVGPEGTAYVFTKERPERGDETPPSRLLMFTSEDGGETWDGEVVFEGVPQLDNPDAAVDPTNGNLYLAWSQRGEERSDPADIYFMASTDAGETWTDPMRLTDDATQGYSKYHPGINVAPNGRVDVAWYDFRNDPFFDPEEAGAGSMGRAAGERYWDVYYSYSTDAGQSWSAETRITDRSIDGQRGVTFANNDVRGPIGLGSTDSSTYLTWADARAGDSEQVAEDAYFTRVRHAPAATDLGPAASSSGATWAIIGAGAALAVGGLVLLIGMRVTRGGSGPAAERVPAGGGRG